MDVGARSTKFVAHDSALVESGAVVGDGTLVWHHSHVRAGAMIGAGCRLGKNVFVDAGAIVGDRCKIQNNVSVYRGVRIGDEVFVGPGVAFTNDLRPRAGTADWTVTPTVVDDGASIGANATVVCGVELGAWCLVGAGAVVTRSVADHEMVVGNPARHHGWVCRCGEVVSRATVRPEQLTCARHADGGLAATTDGER